MRIKRPWREATLWLLCMGAFFFVSYEFADWMAAQRSAVPSIVFGWERRIPFLPWTVVPYWSTDLLYAVSFLICETSEELHTHLKRLFAAQVFCVLVFLVFPLRFSLPVPVVEGPLRHWFTTLGAFDQPFNQAPSLHLALTTVLWFKYSEHTSGFLRFTIRAWLALTAISTLTTYQHHFFDLPTGVWVGLFCITSFPDSTVERLNERTDLRFCSLYLVSAIGLITLAVWIGNVGWVLLWPAGALLLVAFAYFTGSIRFLGSGKMGLASVTLLTPYLLGAKINRWIWTRYEKSAHEITPGVWLGRFPRRAELPQIASVVHLAPEIHITDSKLPCRLVPMLDLVVPSAAKLDAAVEAIENFHHKRPTLVCCALGRSRSASAVVAWLVATGAAPSVESAINLVGSRRRIHLNSEHCTHLKLWAQKRESNGA